MVFSLKKIGFFLIAALLSWSGIALGSSWNTFLGSSATDWGQGIAVDGYGNIYITGSSFAPWGSPPEGQGFKGKSDAFVAKLDPSGHLVWNVFLGSAATDRGQGIAVDGSGHVFVTGYSDAAWGTNPPSILPFSEGGSDAFVAKLDAATGALIWYTFLGSSDTDTGQGIAVDNNGDAYVIGTSDATWGTTPPPVRAFSGGSDAFVAKLDGALGLILWHTFLGSSSKDTGQGIAVDNNGNAYVTGSTETDWGTSPSPVRSFSGESDAFAAKLNLDTGVLLWHTFLGCNSRDEGKAIAVDGIGNIYVTGYSDGAWGIPPEGMGYKGMVDAFAAKLDVHGVLQWNSFLGSFGSQDYGQAIAVDGIGNVFVAGRSDADWGSPENPFSNNSDAFAVKLTGSGTLLWNSFLGSASYDYGQGIAVDGSGNVLVVGHSQGEWGTPIRAFTPGSVGGESDAFVARLSYDLVTISGTITSGGTGLANVVLSGVPGTPPATNASGFYPAEVNSGWSGTVTPSLAGHTFNPPNRTYGSVGGNTPNQGYTATLLTYTISGTIRSGASLLSGVVMTGLPGNPTTNASGFYTATIPYNWNGAVTPTLAGYAFTPPVVVYGSVKSNTTRDYQAVRAYTISGEVWVGGMRRPNVVMNGLPGNPITDGNGNYSAIVTQGWSGTVMPTLEGYSFTPLSFTYTNVTDNPPPIKYTGFRVFTISGTVTHDGLGLPDVVLNGLPDYIVTDAAGYYNVTVYQGWSGTVTPFRVGYRFTPDSLIYDPVNTAQNNKDYTAVPVRTYTISGHVKEDGVALSGVALTAEPGESTVTDSNGFYQMVVNENWSGTVTPGKEGYRFTPESWSYSLLNADQSGKDYTANLRRTISGYIKERGQALAGVTLTFIPGKSTFTDETGRYQITIDQGWSGTVTPVAAGYQFSPQNRIYDHLTLDQPAQDYSVGTMIYLPVILKPN